MEALVERVRFEDYATTRGIKLYVAFLSGTPGRPPALPFASPKEALEGFPNTFVEDQPGVPATTRNWSTVTKIAGLARRRDGN